MTVRDIAPAEFYFTRDKVNFVAFPNSFMENDCDMFDVINQDTDEFVGSFPVSPVQEVDEAFNIWFATQKVGV